MKSFKSWVLFLHRWIGLITGLVVFVVSITGCLLVFEEEISSLMYSGGISSREVQQSGPLSFSRLKQVADNHAPEKSDYQSYSIRVFGDPERSAEISYYRLGTGYSEFDTLKISRKIYLNQYSGDIQAAVQTEESFFGIVNSLHRNLLLGETGRLVVLWSVVIFLFLLLTGLFLWWPRNWRKNQRDKSFKIKWSAKWKRFNYDLHNVPGFYALIPAFIIGFTGLYWYFVPVQKTIQVLSSNDHHVQEMTPEGIISGKDSEGVIREEVLNKYPGSYSITLLYNRSREDAALITVKEEKWSSDSHRYQISGNADATIITEVQSREQIISDLNYLIHTGSIAGLAGKMAAFLVSLVCAALPVTGFFMFWNRFKR